MKYLCVSPQGELEIWTSYTSYLSAPWDSDDAEVWQFMFYQEDSYSKLATISKLPYGPEYFGREILEEWVDK